MTAVDSPQSGTDTKTLEIAGDIVQSGTASIVEASITTTLEDLHVDNGTTSP